MPVTFLHTADWQLGKPFASVEDDSKRERLRHERLACLERIASAVRDHQAEFVVVAGDLFDSPSPTKAVVSEACGAIGAIGVPVFAIPGNHDHGGPGGPWDQEFFRRESRELAPNLRPLLSAEALIHENAVLLPAPLLRRHEPGDPTAWIRTAFEDADFPAGLPRIVIAHGSSQGFSSARDEEEGAGGDSNLIDLERLPVAEIDYVALGDWHGMKQVGPKAWYSGTPEPDRFPKGERNEPGFILKVTVGRGRDPEVTPVPTARLGWHRMEFTFHDDADLARLEEEFAGLIGIRAASDLLRLELDGFLGIGASTRLEELLDSWRSRLLRLKLADRTRVVPSEAEVAALTGRSSDPLISRVAGRLLSEAGGDSEEAAIARIALRELHAACSS